MSKSTKPLIAGNWKMNGLSRDLDEIGMMVTGYVGELPARLDMAVCTPFTLVREAARLADAGPLEIGAQDCHPQPSGAHTGDISAEMIADCGARFVIVGHSERRQDHGEDDALVRRKAEAVLRAGLTPILCIGETEDERRANATLSVLGRQLEGSLPDEANLVVAYEPVWAIGTGMTASADDVGEAHAFIRKTLIEKFGKAGSGVRILYGGSVKPANAAELLGVPEVNGALVGGASLKSEDFLAIAAACTAP